MPKTNVCLLIWKNAFSVQNVFSLDSFPTQKLHFIVLKA